MQSIYKKLIFIILIFIINLEANNFLSYDVTSTRKIILDTETNIMWQKFNAYSSDTWSNAIGSCNDSIFGSYEDWFLPNLNELQTIIDYSSSDPAINSIFIAGSNMDHDFWTSTVERNSAGKAYIIRFESYGAILGGYDQTETKFYMCARYK